jgi:hypothetical protein
VIRVSHPLGREPKSTCVNRSSAQSKVCECLARTYVDVHIVYLSQVNSLFATRACAVPRLGRSLVYTLVHCGTVLAVVTNDLSGVVHLFSATRGRHTNADPTLGSSALTLDALIQLQERN